MAYPTDITSDTPSAGTSLLSSPDHSNRHNVNGSAITNIELKLGLGASSAVVDKALIGSGNGTSGWSSSWNNGTLNNATLGTPSITGGTITSSTFVNVTGITKPFVTVGTANADYTTDGTADDVQIQAAIDAVGSLGGGVVYLKAGTYNLTNTTAIPAFLTSDTGAAYCGVVLKDKVSLKGDGIGKSVISVASFAGTALGIGFIPVVNSAIGQTYQGVSDLSITMPSFSVSSGPYGAGIALKGVSKTILQNVYITNGSWRIYGGTFSWNNTTKELTTDTHDILFDNLTSDTFKDSSFLFNLKNVTVRNSTFLTSYDDAILIAQAAHNILVEGCTFDGDNTGVGAATAMIYVVNDGNTTTDVNAMRDIRIIGNSLRRFNMNTGASAGILVLTGTDIQIVNNYIDGMKGEGFYNRAEGTIKNILIQGNTIKNCLSAGIKLPLTVSGASLFGAQIIGNTIYNNATYGVYFETTSVAGTASGALVTNNEIYDNQGTATQTSGIHISTGGTKNFTNFIVANNNVHDTTTPYNFAANSGSITGGQTYVNGGTLSHRGAAGSITVLAQP